MRVSGKPFSENYQTNCYIAHFDDFEFIVDPGKGSVSWVKEQCNNPKAILLTHAHFDHIWSVKELQRELNIPVYIHKDDAFLLNMNQAGNPTATADFEISETIQNINDTKIEFFHVPGHTPGLCMIKIQDFVFSGDFIFANGGIGRFDFPYSDEELMKQSLKKFLTLEYEAIVYPGHGPSTTIKKEQENVKRLLKAYRWA